MKKRYKLISEDLVKSLIDFLDEVQFDAATEKSTEDMQKINFCSYAIEELLNGYDAYFKDKKPQKPQNKTRDDYVEETFMDWNLPEMDDEEYEKFVNQVDGFLRGWEKKYQEEHPNEPIQERPYKPNMDDVMEWCELDEVIEFLKDDPELSDEERFELYYDERERRNPKNKGLSYDELLKKSGLLPSTKK